MSIVNNLFLLSRGCYYYCICYLLMFKPCIIKISYNVAANNNKDDGVALTCEDKQNSTDIEQSLKKRKQVPYFDIAKNQADDDIYYIYCSKCGKCQENMKLIRKFKNLIKVNAENFN